MKKTFWLFVVMLLAIDQGIELIVWNFFMEFSGTPILESIVYFYPTINIYLSYINSLLGIPANMIIINMIHAFFLFIGLCLKKHLEIKGITSKLMSIGLLFFVAWCMATIVDRIFWGGSLDFIEVRGFFIFGPENVYFAIAYVCFLTYIIVNRRTVGTIKFGNVIHFLKDCVTFKFCKQ